MALMTITGAEWNRMGVTREVILTRRYAIKIPKLVYGWKLFLCGLLANMQERDFGRAGWPQLCPLVWSVPGGWLVVQRRAEPLADDEWACFDAPSFCVTDDYVLPVEFKRDSFGKIDGRIVAVDYGN